MLRVTLRVNADQIGDYEIRNVGATGHGDYRYEIRPIADGATGDLIGTVWHYRAAGAERLAAVALEAIARTARKRPTADTKETK